MTTKEVNILEVRQMTAAYLFHGSRVLLIRKEKSQLHGEPFWSGLGGHMEAEELNHPQATCFREIQEESGLTDEDITGLELKYVLLRIKEREIRQQFVYMGFTDRTDAVPSDEGELDWIEVSELMELPMSAINRFMLEHYLLSPNREGITVGTITTDLEGNPCMQWAELKDPGRF
ncbi:NUDIX domain-containing protein [Paenibacillus protaetiae]|uniref:NUDIX domain-containing protein n=1 Tax=Paenibacillus protaetiae TaxID=2509456 RepID=A0A4P6F0H0_9BACL|nr:NUDIX domain-containing protein [Paenibacillus protaetiae]QAY68093.1 NUDIX domain-containing protein [Paenibacillus protaetiae]